MKEYTDQEIKNLLLEDDYPNKAPLLDGVIQRIRSFGSEATKMFDEWASSGKQPKFEINGISSDNLRKEQNMKAVALIIAYDWLMKEPHEAARLLLKPHIKQH
ncbi:MAG: hypothetical protein J6031_02200 [Bacteroidales bacterium]|nr:hypothetical protein [Bacteroidales bacterium]